jgi:membrane-bound inhibitor of C-type lysozyme
MKLTGVIACSALMIFGLSALAKPVEKVVNYRCQDGLKFTMSFSGAADNFAKATLSMAGQKPQTMRAVRAASGAHYANSNYAYDEWHNEIQLKNLKTKRSVECSAE